MAKARGWAAFFIVAAGGKVIKPIFAFPGGCRFHFIEPGGNEFAAWSEPQPCADELEA